ncbi:Protein of unknown function [Cotesia congregata]|uniref:Uncharacterized protein n=1 Tax=Cotesia congregata TaxID=51543 RepID=A0A8J2H0J5_COTCN|nr:Protein of unknown function [Cotesia congregata]
MFTRSFELDTTAECANSSTLTLLGHMLCQLRENGIRISKKRPRFAKNNRDKDKEGLENTKLEIKFSIHKKTLNYTEVLINYQSFSRLCSRVRGEATSIKPVCMKRGDSRPVRGRRSNFASPSERVRSRTREHSLVRVLVFEGRPEPEPEPESTRDFLFPTSHQHSGTTPSDNKLSSLSPALVSFHQLLNNLQSSVKCTYIHRMNIGRPVGQLDPAEDLKQKAPVVKI